MQSINKSLKLLKHKKGNIYKSIFENEKMKNNKSYLKIIKNYLKTKKGNIYKSIFENEKMKINKSYLKIIKNY